MNYLFFFRSAFRLHTIRAQAPRVKMCQYAPMAMAAVVPSASNTYSNSFIFAVPVFILEAASFLIGGYKLFFDWRGARLPPGTRFLIGGY